MLLSLRRVAAAIHPCALPSRLLRCCHRADALGTTGVTCGPQASAAGLQTRRFHIHSPLVTSDVLTRQIGWEGDHKGRKVLLKLDNTQPSGSFKIRGIGHICKKAFEEGKTRLVSSSGGNAGNAVAYSGKQLGMPVTVIVPSSTSADVVEKIKQHGANVEVHGSVWDEADAVARQLAEDEDTAYIHPFAQTLTWEGHSSLVNELKKDMAQKPGLVCVSVGGGGLLLGVLMGLRAVGWGDVPVLAVETYGAHSLHESMKQGKLVTLDDITSIAKTLGAKTVAPEVFEMAVDCGVRSIAVSDRECLDALKSFADTHRFLVEPACAASLTPLFSPAVLKRNAVSVDDIDGDIVAIVCGGVGVDTAAITRWESELAARGE